MEPQADFKLFFLGSKDEEFLRLFALNLKGAYTSLELCKNVTQTDKIFLCLCGNGNEKFPPPPRAFHGADPILKK